MNFEIVDNIFQILVLFCVMIASAVTAIVKKRAGTFCSLQAATAAL